MERSMAENCRLKRLAHHKPCGGDRREKKILFALAWAERPKTA